MAEKQYVEVRVTQSLRKQWIPSMLMIGTTFRSLVSGMLSNWGCRSNYKYLLSPMNSTPKTPHLPIFPHNPSKGSSQKWLLTSLNLQLNPKAWVLPPLSNSWIRLTIWLYIALNKTPNMDCYWGGGSTQPEA